MAKYRSASLHVLGSEKASSADVPRLPGLDDAILTPEADAACEASAASDAEADADDASVVGPAHHALSRPRARRGVAPAWLAGGAAMLALLGLFAWGSHDAFGPRKGVSFPCPPATASAVRAATGCAVPPPPAIDGEDEE